VSVDELSADDIRAKLEAGDLDLGIAYRPAEPSDLRFEPLRNEEMVLAVSPQHPFAARKRLRMVELDRNRLVLLPHSFATRVMLDECFRTAGAEPVVCAQMSTIAPMLELVSRTLIGAIVAANTVPAQSGLCVVPLANPTPTRIPGILWRREAKQTRQMRAFASIVRKLAHARGARVRGAATA
jgi:LysR family cyn operon transcriptional activator